MQDAWPLKEAFRIFIESISSLSTDANSKSDRLFSRSPFSFITDLFQEPALNRSIMDDKTWEEE
jgi:hypothetical protein